MISRHLIRAIFGVATLTLLIGCAQRQSNFIQQVLELGTDVVLQEDAKPQPLPSRAQLDAVGRPILAISREDSPAVGFVVAVAQNTGGYVTFQDQARRSVILRGGQLSGTQGFGYDLSAIKVQRNDPIVFQTPVAAWPKTLVRNYQFSLQHTSDFQVSVTCILNVVAREEIVIFDTPFETTRIQEDCNNDRRRFRNVYWADATTGFIWRSKQWIGPKVSAMTLEVVTPTAP